MKINKSMFLGMILAFNVVFSLSLATSFLPIYLDTLGISLTSIGLIFAVAAIAAGIIRFPLGNFVDKHGKKPLLLLGAIGYPIFAIGLSFAWQTSHFVLLKLFVDLFAAVFWVAFWAYLFNILTRGEEGRQLGMRNFASGVGLVLAPLLAGIIIQNYGFITLFYLSAIISSISLFIILLIREPKTERIEKDMFEEYQSLIHKQKFRFILLVAVLHNIVWAIWYIYMPIYLKGLGLSMALIGGLISVNYLAYTLNSYPIGKMVDKFHSYYLIIPGFFIVSMMGYVFLQVSSYVYLVLSRAVMGFGMNIEWNPLVARLTHLTPKKEHGSSAGLFRAATGITVGVTSLAGGYFAELYGVGTLLFGAVILAFCVGIFLIFGYEFLSGKGRPLNIHRHHVEIHSHHSHLHH